MIRPLKDKRPIGPFLQSSSNSNTVVITCDFDVEEAENPTERGLTREELLNDLDISFKNIVVRAADDYFNGEIADVRIEDHAVADGKRGVRVVYDTNTNAVFKDDIDGFESDIDTRGVRGYLHKITVVASD